MDETNEAIESQAELELFAKIAEEQNIDLSQFSDEQVWEMYNATFDKTASNGTEGTDVDAEVAERAAAEFAANQEKVAEAQWSDEMGRRMAHAYSEELDKIAGVKGVLSNLAGKGRQLGGQAADAGRQAVSAGGKAVGRGRELLSGSRAKTLSDQATRAQKLKIQGKGIPGKARGTADAAAGEAKKVRLARGIAAGAGTAAAGAGGYAAFGGKKEASAIDELALEEATKIAHEEGYDVDEAAVRVCAVYDLGGPEETKIAAAQDLSEAVGIRALEYLEAAGYPVSWE